MEFTAKQREFFAIQEACVNNCLRDCDGVFPRGKLKEVPFGWVYFLTKESLGYLSELYDPIKDLYFGTSLAVSDIRKILTNYNVDDTVYSSVMVNPNTGYGVTMYDATLKKSKKSKKSKK
jgi:hypothetical protein